ncbi:hypothetical protein [Streptomyces narbonensis]|uniref:hypothetical protein n=1 Tax=Streptomyces narbonensis TaxID=67333 RepID=UPI0016780C18|nr:hypothetical protein [Streptomyces narbonensis]GGW01341.1 hypothetical protein GCM10010230_31490 [Streptomyces narbonensis]
MRDISSSGPSRSSVQGVHAQGESPDLAAACTYLAGEGLISVDWEPGNTPAMVSLTHQGIRRMEAEEEERG